MKILNPRTHGYLDYAMVILFPSLTNGSRVDRDTRDACLRLGYHSLCNDSCHGFSFRVVPFIPFTIHGWV